MVMTFDAVDTLNLFLNPSQHTVNNRITVEEREGDNTILELDCMGNHLEQKISSDATFKCHKVTENQSPFQENLAITALTNIWATPCDGVPECENKEDESQVLCSIPEEYSFFSLTTGYWTISVLMVLVLFYFLRKKIRIINPKHWPIG